MENGSSVGIYIAYGAIVLFLFVVAAVVLRTMVLYALLLVAPLRGAWGLFGSRERNRSRERDVIESRDDDPIERG